MKHWKRGLALLLCALMLVTALPLASAATMMGDERAETPAVAGEGNGEAEQAARPAVNVVSEEEEADPLSLLPLEEKTLDVNVSVNLPMELQSVKIADLLAEEIKDTEHPERPLDGTEKVAWCIRGVDEYTVTDMNGTADLSEARGSSYCNLEMIVGSGKQLDGTNVRYLVRANIGTSNDWLVPTIYTQDEEGTRTRIVPKRSELYSYNFRNESWLEATVPEGSMDYNDEVYMGLALKEPLASGYTMKAYLGDDVDYITGEATDITDQLLGQDMEKKDAGYKSNFANSTKWITIELLDGETVVGYETISVNVYIAWTGLGYNWLSSDRAEGSGTEEVAYSNNWERDQDVDVNVYKLYKEYPVDGEYYQRLHFVVDGDSVYDSAELNALKLLAVRGKYDTRAEAEAAIEAGRVQDITQEIFSHPGYKCSFEDTVIFSVFQDQEVYYQAFRAEAGTRSKDPEPQEEGDLPEKNGSEDTYFRVNGVTGLDTYVMPYEHDTYYTNGYQTLLVLEGETPVDLTALKPSFGTGEEVKMYAGEPPEEQKSGETSQDFSAGAVRYSASSGDKENVKNYVVTFVKKDAAGAKLFVNGANAEKESDGSVRRELFMNTYQGNYHDIFIANVGSEALTGLKVELSADAQNVKLDGYWTVGGEGNNSLDPFTTTSRTTDRGELDNVAKIRLVPDGEGEVSGKLTISADGQESVVFTLTGTAGDPVITTKQIPVGVKYVPYGTMIQNSNMYDWNKVSYRLYRGKLPQGVELKPNGEIYGVPQEVGSFTFTVRLTNSVDDFDDSYATYTLVVEENTDENVAAQTDEGYAVQVPVEDFTTSYTDSEFKIEGELGEFIDLWLDGEKLEMDVDYTVEEGSTKATIYSQTFRNAGSGKHTLAAEFRVNGDVNQDMKKSAQNYNSSAGSGHSGRRPSSGSGSKTTTAGWPLKEPEKVPEKEPEKVPEKPQAKDVFIDVPVTAWFYNDVNWAYQSDLVLGVGGNRYDPAGEISQAMVTTLLARMNKADLSRYTDITGTTVAPNQWYTNASVWAWRAGLIPPSGFSAEPPFARGELAVMLVKYLDHQAVQYKKPARPVDFPDAADMTAEQNEAFQILYHNGIVKGVGEGYMAPNTATTRAEMAALIHRMSEYLNDK